MIRFLPNNCGLLAAADIYRQPIQLFIIISSRFSLYIYARRGFIFAVIPAAAAYDEG
jgi:hypothetical protein